MLLDDLNCYLFEYLLSLLPPSDLSQLCLTCRHLYTRTSDYLTLLTTTSHRYPRLKDFLDRNHTLLLPRERALYLHLSQFPADQWERLTALRELHNTIPDTKDIARVSVSSSYIFMYLGDPRHAYESHCDLLDRDVVYLKGINWLKFGTVLPSVRDAPSYPARYRVRLHLQVRPDVHWKGDSPMVLRVFVQGTSEVIRHNFVHPKVWSDLAAGEDPSLDYNGYNDLKNLRIERGERETWYFLVIDNIEVENNENELVFSLDDRQNVFWKSGKSWDFLEISRI